MDSRGFTLLETLLALLLGLMLTVLAWRALADTRRLAERLALRAEALDALRTARHVFERELAGGAPLVLAGPPAPDTLGLRALRGIAVVCPESRRGREVTVVPDGARAPDPAKDSAWILGPGGERTLLAVERSDPVAPCPYMGANAAVRWTLSGDVPLDAALAVYFERGSYHLSGSALRYRRGAAGRQPLTPEVLSAPPSRFESWKGSAALRLVTPALAPARGVMSFVAPAGDVP